MPRIQPWLLRQAMKHSVYAGALIPACKDLRSAINELRWIKEHVNATAQTNQHHQLLRLCKQRGCGVPLQYILGSQPFGSLDIKCKPGVLIPRPETEAYTCHLVDLLKSGNLLGPTIRGHAKSLNIVDFCTGTGCIPLLLFSLLQQCIKRLNVVGVDVSPHALKLARENITHNIKAGSIPQLSSGQSLEIIEGDIFQEDAIQTLSKRQWDVMVSNPPYISRRVWNFGLGQLGYSVRKYEPSLALVPGNHLPIPSGWRHEDVFYARLLDIAHRLKTKVVLLEIGDEEQARHVLQGFFRHKLSATSRVQVWRDWPDSTPNDGEENLLGLYEADGQAYNVAVKGNGHIRSILIQTRIEENE